MSNTLQLLISSRRLPPGDASPLILQFSPFGLASIRIAEKTSADVIIEWGDGATTVVTEPGVYNHAFAFDFENPIMPGPCIVSGGLVALGVDPEDYHSDSVLRDEMAEYALGAILDFGTIPSFTKPRFQGYQSLSVVPAALSPYFTSLDGIFQGCPNLNDPNVSAWDTSNIISSRYSFSRSEFNRPLMDWNVSNIQNMDFMFWGASMFEQDLSPWCVSLIPVEPASFRVGSGAFVSPNWGTCPLRTAPVITGLPTISGTPEVGQMLTASAAPATGVPNPITSWQWVRDGVDINDAFYYFYVPTEDDVGMDVWVRQIETNAMGVDTAESTPVTIQESSPSAPFDPVALFGEDLWEYFGNTIDDLWRTQDGGGTVTIWQDQDGTIPVTALGQTVRRVSDLSGYGNDFIFSDDEDTFGYTPPYLHEARGYACLATRHFTGLGEWRSYGAVPQSPQATTLFAFDPNGQGWWVYHEFTDQVYANYSGWMAGYYYEWTDGDTDIFYNKAELYMDRDGVGWFKSDYAVGQINLTPGVFTITQDMTAANVSVYRGNTLLGSDDQVPSGYLLGGTRYFDLGAYSLDAESYQDFDNFSPLLLFSLPMTVGRLLTPEETAAARAAFGEPIVLPS